MTAFTRIRYRIIISLMTLTLIAGQAFARPQPLQISIFVHKDVEISTDELYENYLSHWEKAMNDISGREVRFEYITDANPITTLNYQHEDLSIPLADIRKFFSWHEQANPRPGHGALRKGLLITQYPINGSTLGVASHLGNAGIASLQTYIAPAHELGHMFGATHDNARGGWTSLCDSYMTGLRNPFKSHCYAFSEANEDVMGEHLIKIP